MDARLAVFIGFCVVMLMLGVSMWPGSRRLGGRQKYGRSHRPEPGPDGGPTGDHRPTVWAIMFPAFFGGSHADGGDHGGDGDHAGGFDGDPGGDGGGDGGGD